MAAIEMCATNTQYHISTMKDNTWKHRSKRHKIQDSSRFLESNLKLASVLYIHFSVSFL